MTTDGDGAMPGAAPERETVPTAAFIDDIDKYMTKEGSAEAALEKLQRFFLDSVFNYEQAHSLMQPPTPLLPLTATTASAGLPPPPPTPPLCRRRSSPPLSLACFPNH